MPRLSRFLIVSAAVAAMAWPAASAWSGQAVPRALMVQALVADQQCQGGDLVQVTLTASTMTTSRPVAYRWDFTNDGSFDTPASRNPTVMHLYPDETTVTARVGAINRAGDRAMDLVTFGTLRCE